MIKQKFFFLVTFIVCFTSLQAKPYRPLPLLLIHGYNGSSKTWGVKPYKPPGAQFNSDSIMADSIESGSTYKHLLNIMQPYILADTFLIQPEQNGYPNRDLLEIYNFKYPTGSFDPDAGGGLFPPWAEQEGWGTELRAKIKKTLKEYYGPNWADNPDVRVNEGIEDEMFK